MNKDQVKAIYDSLKPDGRSNQCPRPGVYKILSVYEGHFHNKFAFMAKANWKPTENDSYVDDFIVEIQLESLKRNCSEIKREQLTKSALEGMQLKVHFAINTSVRFILGWNIIPLQKIDLEALNMLFKSGALPIDNIFESENAVGVGFDDDSSDLYYDEMDEIE